MALKAVAMTLAVLVLLSLSQIPALMAVEQTDLVSLLAKLDFDESAKIIDESCECACTRMVPPNFCRCKDALACPKCVCKQTLPVYGVPVKYCESLPSRLFQHFCPTNPTNEGTHAYTIV